MNRQDYGSPEAGRIVRGLDGTDAFLPSPLPPEFEWTPDLTAALSRADAVVGELSGIGRLLPAPELLIRPYLQREAVLSSRIEGTRTTLDELLREEPGPNVAESQDADATEVRNYVAAMDYGLDALTRRPVISLNLVLDLHRVLMTGVPGPRGRNASPGRFRTTQNWIGTPGSTPTTASYVPPPPERLTECLTRWERFVNEPSRIPDLIRCAMMHEHFEAIHPFNDGNGRIGRLLMTLFLVERGRLSRPLLYLSEYIEANRDGYYSSLQRIRTHGDWANWVLYFLEGVSVTGRRALDQTIRLVDLRKAWRTRLGPHPRLVALIDPLLSNPYMTVARASRELGTSDPTSRAALFELEAAGLLTQIPSGSRRRLYLSHPIMEIIYGSDPD